MDDNRSSADRLLVLAASVDVSEHSIGRGQQCVRRAQLKLTITKRVTRTNYDLADVADVASIVAIVKVRDAPWIVVATGAGAAIREVSERMDVQAVSTWG